MPSFLPKQVFALPLCTLYALAVAQAQPRVEDVLHSFGTPPQGANPTAGVIRDSAGNLYGTANRGGTGGSGVVYEVSAAGAVSVLYSFPSSGANGAYPLGGVALTSAGDLFGTTSGGGTGSAGVVYKVYAGKETVIYNFSGGTDGKNPWAGVILDSAGNLYGTTYSGGAGNAGVVYKVNQKGAETVLYAFSGGPDGGSPNSGLIRDAKGNFYGVTAAGGLGRGVVYKLDAAGHETVLHSFTGSSDGGLPDGGLTLDSAGNLYGTANIGGQYGAGVVFKLDPAGNETILYNFTGQQDGNNPFASLVRDPEGNLYGTALVGFYVSIVFKLNPAGQETVLYSFSEGDVYTTGPRGGIVESGNTLYGTTFAGGTGNAGIVYSLNTSGQETTLFGFPDAVGGTYPGPVTRDSSGNLYGTTEYGGKSNSGVVYKLDSSEKLSVLYNFQNGTLPFGNLVLDSKGNLYGVAFGGGAGNGFVYKVNSAGAETVLYLFAGGSDGSFPTGLTIDAEGNLYGTAASGGTYESGVVFEVDAAGVETVLYNFTGGTDGGNPYAGVIRDSAGNLYGTTMYGGADNDGVIFRVNPGGQETVLYSFIGGRTGGNPPSGVIRDQRGNLYGTTATSTSGNVYKLDSAGNYTVLYTFSGGADGGDPYAGLALDAAGNLYGTAAAGGAYQHGVVYEVTSSGQEAVLHNFTGGNDGGIPYTAVVLDSAGNLYGSTQSGGSALGGVVYKIAP
jgi:uncharacterized repeat protein (TIGR03803 family)